MMHRLVNIVSERKVARRLDDKLSSVFVVDLTDISRSPKEAGNEYEERWHHLCHEMILMRASTSDLWSLRYTIFVDILIESLWRFSRPGNMKNSVSNLLYWNLYYHIIL